MENEHAKEKCNCPCDNCQTKCQGHSILAQFLRDGDRVKWFDPEKNAYDFGTVKITFYAGQNYYSVRWDNDEEDGFIMYDDLDFGKLDEGFIDRA